MSARTAHRMLVSRLIAGALLVVTLVLCASLRAAFGHLGPGGVFCLVMTLCVALVFLTRNLGRWLGVGVGVPTGLLAAGALALQFSIPFGSLAAFVLVSTVILGLLGHLAGSWDGLCFAGAGAGTAEAPPAASPDARGQWSASAGSGLLADELLSTIATDFSQWVESQTGRQCYVDSSDWSGFDQFVRTVLRERLGARGVRVYGVSADGQALEPLAGSRTASAGQLSAHTGVLGQTVSSGRVHVADESAGAAPGEPSAAAEAQPRSPDANATGSPPAWAWLLPIRAAKRTCALVAVRRVDRPDYRGLAVAVAVRNQLQLFWDHVCVLRTLWRLMRTDRQSGMLERTELLSRMETLVRNSLREGEPVMVLALAIEGLRRLDDSGRWSQRDALVQRLGQVLGQKVRSDDLLGRFSDDRFVVVLRRVDSALGTLVAEKLMEGARSAVLELATQTPAVMGVFGGEARLRLRAGLAGMGCPSSGRAARPFATFDCVPVAPERAAGGTAAVCGRLLLERAMGLLEYAREQRIDLATDLMKGLPERLRRPASEQEVAVPVPDNPPATP